MADIRDSIIIGSGPAGYTAAVYLARAQLNPLVFAGEQWGGQLMLTTEVENYPGFKNGILGPELMNEMRGQAERFGAEIVDKSVRWVDFSERPFLIGIGDKPSEMGKYREKLINIDKSRIDQDLSTSIDNLATVYQTWSVVISTGAKARMLGIGEERLLGRGVSTCAVCDAAFYKDKVTFVVGGGDAAMEEVLALVKFTRSVTLVHRRDKLRASKIMQQRVLEENKEKVKVLRSTEVKEVKGEKKLEAIVVENKKTGKRSEYVADGLFLAIGYVPETEIFKGQVMLDKKGYLITGLNGLLDGVPQRLASNSRQAMRDDTAGLDSLPVVSTSGGMQALWLEGYPTMTSVPGVFGAGDVMDFRYRQAITAAGFGCMAALDVEKYLTGSSQTW